MYQDISTLGHDRLITWSMDFLRKKWHMEGGFLLEVFLVCSMEKCTDKGILVYIFKFQTVWDVDINRHSFFS